MSLRNPIRRVLGALGRKGRLWRPEPLMPSILFDLNHSLVNDLGLVPQDVAEVRRRRRRGD